MSMQNVDEKNFPKIGGKAKNLYILSKNRFSVPEFYIITTGAYQNYIKENKLEEKIKKIIDKTDFENKKSISDSSKQIKELFMSSNIPEEDLKSLLSFYKRFKKDENAEYVAIRSSAIGEDDVKTSFAGQMDSFLFISEEKSYIDSIKKCWASVFSERALTYRHISKLPLANIKIAVIVQKMIFGDVSGVMFTANPMNNKLDEIVINSTYGIGEGIVSGELDTDIFCINKENNEISEQLTEKTHEIVFNEKNNQGTAKKALAKQKMNKSSISKNQIKKLAEIGKRIQELYGAPQDIEWTIKSNKIYILQTRPITTLITKAENEIVWDNSNIIESFPGITKPLTFSFAKMAWASVFRQSARSMGVDEKTIQENDKLFNNMLGLVNGRVYYNLMNWYQFVSFFPGFKDNRKYMEQMMGVKESYNYKKQRNRFLTKEGILSIPELMRLIYGLAKNYLIIDGEVKKFQENFQTNYDLLINYDFKQMKSKEVMDIFNQAKKRLLEEWKVEGINDYSAMVFYGLVRNLTKKYKLDESGSIHNDLFCGERDMDSTRPTKELISLSNKIKSDKNLYKLFNENKEKLILEKVYKNKEYFDFKESLTEYLDEFGFRCMSELKLEEKSLKDDPTFVITIIKNYLNLENLDLDGMNQSEIEKRLNAEKTINEKLRWRPLRKTLFHWALRNARKSVRYRENMRLSRTKVFGLVREAFRAIGENFAKNGIIIKSDDIFYLEIDEIFNFIKGENKTKNLKNLVKIRKEAYGHFEKMELPERFTTHGDFDIHLPVEIIAKEEIIDSKKDVLTGVSCCPGVVKNKVKIILSPSDNVELNGEILVADKTDPGWVPLYPSVSGLLIERGSVLSHSAIVARELGLPTIVGIKGLTKKVKDGQIVKMDAGKGIVYLKPKNKEKN